MVLKCLWIRLSLVQVYQASWQQPLNFLPIEERSYAQAFISTRRYMTFIDISHAI